MCQAWERSRHSVVTMASFLRGGSGSAGRRPAPATVAPAACKKVRREIMVAPSVVVSDRFWGASAPAYPTPGRDGSAFVSGPTGRSGNALLQSGVDDLGWEVCRSGGMADAPG